MSYIDRELLLIGVDGCISALHVQAKGDLVQEGSIKLVEATRDYIASLSIADVVEARHGRWLKRSDGTPYCSNCGANERDTYSSVVNECAFCYSCGARMDKEDEHEAG